jgi:hypothetical protein
MIVLDDGMHQVFLQAQFQVVDLKFLEPDVTQTKDLANVLRAGNYQLLLILCSQKL